MILSWAMGPRRLCRRAHSSERRPAVLFDLNSLIDPQSGWNLMVAKSINDAGQIVGWGPNATTTSTFLLTPIAPTRGDFNFDGVVTSSDIQAMLKALTDLQSFKAANILNDDGLLTLGDFNDDEIFSNEDIQPMLNLLVGPETVPEPASWALLAVGSIVLARRVSIRRRRSPRLSERCEF
jgi:hypothetical protein